MRIESKVELLSHSEIWLWDKSILAPPGKSLKLGTFPEIFVLVIFKLVQLLSLLKSGNCPEIGLSEISIDVADGNPEKFGGAPVNKLPLKSKPPSAGACGSIWRNSNRYRYAFNK